MESTFHFEVLFRKHVPHLVLLGRSSVNASFSDQLLFESCLFSPPLSRSSIWWDSWKWMDLSCPSSSLGCTMHVTVTVKEICLPFEFYFLKLISNFFYWYMKSIAPFKIYQKDWVNNHPPPPGSHCLKCLAQKYCWALCVLFLERSWRPVHGGNLRGGAGRQVFVDWFTSSLQRWGWRLLH